MPWAEAAGRSIDADVLRGVVGTIFHLQRMGQAQRPFDFVAYEPAEIGGFSRVRLQMYDLFWLAMGYLPLSDRRILGLENVWYSIRSPSPSLYDVAYTPQQHDKHFAQHKQAVYNYIYRDRVRGGARDSDTESMADVYVPASLQPQAPRQQGQRLPRKWGFTLSKDCLEEFVEVASVFKAESNTQRWSLTDLDVDQKKASILQEDARRTYVPCDRPWVFLNDRHTVERTGGPMFFLRRSDAQLLARALIQLPMCSQGYLFHASRDSLLRRLLVEAYILLPRLLYFMIKHFDCLTTAQTLPRDVPQALQAHLATLFRMTERYAYSREFASTLYELDCCLSELIGPDTPTHLFVQVITTTSPEFRDIISQSLRDLEICLYSNIVFDWESKTLAVGTVLGVIKKFPVDVDVLVDNLGTSQTTGQVELSYDTVLFVMLKACLRSTFLKTSLDSAPLFKSFLGSQEDLEMISFNPESYYQKHDSTFSR
jgi:hypothetical protein